jgi:hypothetical protein
MTFHKILDDRIEFSGLGYLWYNFELPDQHVRGHFSSLFRLLTANVQSVVTFKIHKHEMNIAKFNKHYHLFSGIKLVI